MSTLLEAAKAVYSKVKDLGWEEAREALKEVPEEVQKAYRKLRKDMFFDPKNAGKSKEKLSPSGKYKLVVTSFSTGPKSWNYSQGQVFAQGSDTPIATVQRNYSAFPFLFVEGHPKGDFLVCGEDYQGQTVVELATGNRRDFLPESAKQGAGFCWASYEWVPSMQALLVDGCYWAAPYEFRFYDFSDPMSGWSQIGEDICIDSDDRKPELFPDGTIKVFQTEYTEPENDTEPEEEEEKLGPIAAWTTYRREGLKFVELESWVSEKEQGRRQRNKEYNERQAKWWADFKANDPLFLTMLEGVKDPVFKPSDYYSTGITHERWCPDFKKEETRVYRRIHERGKNKTGYSIDLEWGAVTGPVKLVIYKDGQTSEDKFWMDHSVESMKAALAYAKGLLS